MAGFTPPKVCPLARNELVFEHEVATSLDCPLVVAGWQDQMVLVECRQQGILVPIQQVPLHLLLQLTLRALAQSSDATPVLPASSADTDPASLGASNVKTPELAEPPR